MTLTNVDLENGKEITISRLLSCTRDEVWRAWTEPGRIEQWWGPDGFKTTTKSRDMRVGGEWRFTMHGPDGRDYQNRIVFSEIKKPERISYRHTGEEDMESVQFESVVTFAERPGGTLVTLNSRFATQKARGAVIVEHGAVEGGKQHLVRMEADIAAHRAPLKRKLAR